MRRTNISTWQVGITFAGLMFTVLGSCKFASAQTKPSDVFFSQSSNPPWGMNEKPAASIVAKGVTVRGWLVKEGIPSPNSLAVFINLAMPDGFWGTTIIGYEDVHYDLALDYDFIQSASGLNSQFGNAMLHGNPIDSQTNSITIQDTGPSGQLLGIDVNSFWLPNSGSFPLTLHTELNSWHQRSSHRCGLFGWFCGSFENYIGRGSAPDGWCEKEYSPGPPNGNTNWCDKSFMTGPPNTSSDNWWPFNPDDPDGLSGENGPAYLAVGDYVEIQGALWEDTAHDSGTPTGCWSELYHNQDGWLEIHPVDSLRRLYPPGQSPPSPINSLVSAQAGIKRVIAFALCTGASAQPSAALYTVCPEKTYVNGAPPRHPQLLTPHVLELVDWRFSAPSEGLSHGTNIVNDCVSISGSLAAGIKYERFKATYVVWWTHRLRGPIRH